MRTRTLLALGGALGALCFFSFFTAPGCNGDPGEEENIIVPEGKADDYFAMTAQEYVVQGTSQVTLEATYATADEETRLARAKTLIGLKHVAIEWFLNVYLIDKSDHDANESYGGFKSMVKAGSYEDLNILEMDDLTYEFTFQMIVGGTNDLLTLLPTTTGPDGRKQFTLQMGKPTNTQLARLELNSEWYRSAPFSDWDPTKHTPEEIEPLVLTVWPETRSADAWIDYSALFADGRLTLAVHFGWDYHAEYHLKHSESLYKWLTGTMGFASPVASYTEYTRTSGPLTRTFTAQGREVTAEISLYWGQPGTDTDPDTDAGGIQLEDDMRESLRTKEVIMYSGHSGYLYGFALANWRVTSEGDLDDSEIPGLDLPADVYQLVLAEGCDTYAMGEAFWQNPAKAGHKNLDVITTTSFSNASTPAVVQDVISALVPRSGEHQPSTYAQVIRDLDTNSYWFNTMYGVHGIDDNPKLHPYADLTTLCQSCTQNSQCGGVGNQCSRLNDQEKVCTAFCTDDSGCPAGYVCLASAQAYTVQSRQCVPAHRSCLTPPETPGPTVILNEVLADPPLDASGDANGDGLRDAIQDEFVELVNVSGGPVSLEGFTVSDGLRVRFTFPAGAVLAPGQAAVLFGGGTPSSFSLPGAGDALVFASGEGLGLTNTGDTVTLADAKGDVLDQLTFGSEGGRDRALVRAEDGDPAASFIPHPSVVCSPGARQDGTPFTGGL